MAAEMCLLCEPIVVYNSVSAAVNPALQKLKVVRRAENERTRRKVVKLRISVKLFVEVGLKLQLRNRHHSANE
jgi:hypothetical protein